VNVQDARVWLRDQIIERQPSPKWVVTLQTFPKLSGTVEVVVGHAAPTADNWKAGRVILPVTWWVNEGNEQAAVREMYGALWGEGSLRSQLEQLPLIKRTEVTEVGPEVFGPTGWVRALSEFVVILSDLPTDSEEEIS
jgi:hypothetical protein